MPDLVADVSWRDSRPSLRYWCAAPTGPRLRLRIHPGNILGFQMHPQIHTSSLHSHSIVEIYSELQALQLPLDLLPCPHPRCSTFNGHQLLALTLPNGFQSPRAIHWPSVWVSFFRLRKTLTKPPSNFFPRTKSNLVTRQFGAPDE